MRSSMVPLIAELLKSVLHLKLQLRKLEVCRWRQDALDPHGRLEQIVPCGQDLGKQAPST